jgi:hypothetical protein
MEAPRPLVLVVQVSQLLYETHLAMPLVKKFALGQSTSLVLIHEVHNLGKDLVVT